MNKRGATLIEILIGIIIVSIASIATLSYFAYAKGGIGKTGNRRAALERARQRLEQLIEVNADDIKPPVDGQMYELFCTGTPCAWSLSAAPVTENSLVGQPTTVDDLPSHIAATVQWKDDCSAGTGNCVSGPFIYDTLELAVRVWYTPDFSAQDDFNRVHVRTLRTP